MNTSSKRNVPNPPRAVSRPKGSSNTVRPRRRRNRRIPKLSYPLAINNTPLNAPVSLGTVGRPAVLIRSAPPTKPGSEFRVLGCDYIGSVSSSATLGVDHPYDSTPLNATTFPRLSSIALVFGKYSYNKLRFIVIGKSAATVAGDMTSVFSYGDSGAALTESQVKNRVGQVTSKFWENHMAEADPKKATVPWYINYDSALETQTFGYYHLFTETTGAVIGAVPVADIFIEYDIEFCEAIASGDGDV